MIDSDITTSKNTIHESLGIDIIEANKDKVVATMMVGPKVHQPFGLLHGGASVVLAESAASVGAAMNIDLSSHRAVGIEINANHLKSKRDGLVTATASPIHKGRNTHVWSIEIKDEEEKVICISRCTIAIIKAR